MIRPASTMVLAGLLAAGLVAAPIGAQTLPEAFSTGPAIPDHGPVAPQPEDAFNLVPGEKYRVLFDVASGSRDEHVLNRRLESVARFLNLHARAGFDTEDLQIEVVTHGGTTFDVLSREAYRKRFDVAHPNADLLKALQDAGVTVYLCGQSASAHGVATDELAPGVKLAHSAMTVLVRRQSEGWVLMP
ncbi:DsrE family protein [Thioalkalivibrio sp.]|uniref:DsrE family protein n=1 Tax=Thioalkalivibrio sp. TaxID=2093813 RepID=UPI003976ABC3